MGIGLNASQLQSQVQETLIITSPGSDQNYEKLSCSEVIKKLFDFFDVIPESDDGVVLGEIVDTYGLSTGEAIYVHHGKHAIVFAHDEDGSGYYTTVRVSRKVESSPSSDIAKDLPYLCKLTTRVDFDSSYYGEFEVIQSPYIPKVLGVKPTVLVRCILLQQLYHIFSSPSIERVKSQIPYSIEFGKELATSLKGFVGENGLFVKDILRGIRGLDNILMYSPDNLLFDFFIPGGHGDLTGDNTMMRYRPGIDDLLSNPIMIYLIDLPDNPREKNLLFDLFALSSVGFSFATNQYIVLNTRQSLPPSYSSDFQGIPYNRYVKKFHKDFTKEVAMYVYHIYLKSPISRENTKPRNKFYRHWLDWVKYNIFHIVGYCFDQLRIAYESENRKLIVYYTNALNGFYIDYSIIKELKNDSIPDLPNSTMIEYKEELLNINMIVYNEELLKQYTGLTIDQFNSLLECLPFLCVNFCSLTENLSPFELMFARIVFAIMIYNIVQKKIKNKLSKVDKITNFFQSNYNLNLSGRILSIISKIPIKEWKLITDFYSTLRDNEK